MQTKSFYLIVVKYRTWWIDLCVGTFWTSPAQLKQYRDNTDNRDSLGHYNRDKKCSYRYIPVQFEDQYSCIGWVFNKLIKKTNESLYLRDSLGKPYWLSSSPILWQPDGDCAVWLTLASIVASYRMGFEVYTKLNNGKTWSQYVFIGL